MLYVPKNTQTNRSAGLLNKKVRLLERRHGFAYFAIPEEPSERRFAVANEELFNKEFAALEEDDVMTPITIQEGIRYRKYPIEFRQGR